MEKDYTEKKAAVFLQGRIKNGEVFEETHPEHPVVITLGTNSFFPAVEQGLLTMQPGETRIFTLSPEQAYGPHYPELVQKIERSVFSGRIDPKPGMILSLNLEQDNGPEKVPATVIETSTDSITVDYNHPLAGKEVVYVVTLERWLS
ncbi:MAG: FKBP-type peptidyl-prolyl cis-trans isomerase [Desulfobulbaceae bacterium]|nr:FKBP-type peptidyl-prolyl cis-trans isomerase [Desulfobulbaceae bacterium]